MRLIVRMYKYRKPKMQKPMWSVSLFIFLVILLWLTITDLRFAKRVHLVQVASDTQLPEDDQDSSDMKICLCNCVQQIQDANTPLDKVADIPDYSDLNNLNIAFTDPATTLVQTTVTLKPDDNSINLEPIETSLTSQFADDPDQMIDDFTNRFDASDLPDNELSDINYNHLTDGAVKPHGEKYIFIVTIILVYVVLKFLLM